MKFGGADITASRAWFDALGALRQQSLAAIGLAPAAGAADPLLAFIVFLGDTQPWRLPLIDREPTIPLSESARVAPYDQTHNYLWWLTQMSRADLASEHFLGADNASVPPPAALLYVVLRYALLAAIENASLEIAATSGVAFFDVVDRDPLIANIGGEQHVARRDYLEVDAARLGLASSSMPLADWLLDAADSPSHDSFAPVNRIAEVREAIGVLADLPTSRLERLFTEHLDVCAYRLDAWITGLYADRLASMQAGTPSRELHLGAFGWVENLRPAERETIDLATIPPALREGVGTEVYADAANGGYIHAPSLLQAATAAVLRNGYLSHADPSLPNAFAVNLSSGRVRAALALMEGVRAGQPIAALLGYQLERGLHERHPGLELDAFIFALRDHFPLLSGRLSELSAGALAENVEARNVVDGLALHEATRNKTYPFDISDLPAPGTPEADAIASEVDRLHDTFDAVSDLLIAESVHQTVQGNLARTHSALDAMTAPEAPPDPEIVRTPRSGRVLAFRIVLALDATATGGWSDALSPRARANQHLNHWLSEHLPPPAHVEWTIQDGSAAPIVQSLAESGLEPLDVVLMSQEGNGEAASELARYLIAKFRTEHAVADQHATRIGPVGNAGDAAAVLAVDFSRAGGHGVSLAKLRPLLLRLRRIVTQSRATHAGDWRRAADAAQADATDPMGCASGHPDLEHFADLVERIEATSQALKSAADALKQAIDAVTPLRAALDTDPSAIADPSWPSAVDDVRQTLFALVPFGVPEAVPVEGLDVTTALIDHLLLQGRAVSKAVRERLARASALRATVFADPLPVDEPARSTEIARRNYILRSAYSDVAKALLGPSFVVLPLYRFAPAQASELQQALAAPTATPLDVEQWLHSASRVRARASDLALTFATTRWIGRPIDDPSVAQLPFASDAPWIGGRFGNALPSGEYLSLLVLDAFSTRGSVQAGLLIDDWTETVPTDRETTGLAFNFNRPNALAPQALLVAVPAERRGQWDWEDLVGSVHEALDLAKLRAVEPDMLIGRSADQAPPFGDYFQALPAILSEFTGGRIATADFAARVAAVFASQPN